MGQSFSSEPVVEKETERDHNDTFTVAVSSCQGWRMSQEDNHSLILDLPGDFKAAFFAVFDGHGSARVSKHASEGLWRHLVENDLYLKGQFRDALESAFLTFDREVNESYNAQLAGTTAVSILVVDNIIYCANIGDSRAVASVNCECKPLSHDHKPENPLELKRILVAGGYVLGNRVNGNLALSRAFGDFHYKSNDQLPPQQQIVSPCPDITTIELNDDLDFVVLACDGIWDVLSSEEVVMFVIEHLERNLEVGTICELLTTRCLATDYEHVIGCDNMTVLLVCHTRGRSWNDYCTDIFNKNTKRLGGAPRTRTLAASEADSDAHLASQTPRIDQFASRTTRAEETSNTQVDGDEAAAARAVPKGDENSSMTRQAKELLDLLNSLRRDTTSQKSDDEQHKAPNEEQVETVTVLDPSDERPSESSQEKKGVSSKDGDEADKEDTPLDETRSESVEELSSKVNEIHLSSPDERDDDDKSLSKEERSSSEQPEEQLGESSSSNVVEIQLSSPDEDKAEEDTKAIDEKEEEEQEAENNCLNEDEIEPIEIVNEDTASNAAAEETDVATGGGGEETSTENDGDDGQTGDGD